MLIDEERLLHGEFGLPPLYPGANPLYSRACCMTSSRHFAGPCAPLFFSLTLVAILGVGIGATATMVSVLDTLLWRPVAMPRPNEFVEITTVGPEGWERGVPVAAASRIIRADLPVGGWCAFDRNWFVTRRSTAS